MKNICSSENGFIVKDESGATVHEFDKNTVLPRLYATREKLDALEKRVADEKYIAENETASVQHFAIFL